MNRKMIIALMLVFISCVISTSAIALMKSLSTDELVKLSDSVVEGDVISVETRWSHDKKTILTRSTIQIKEVVRGAVTDKTIVVDQVGGEIDGLGLKVSDVELLTRNEKVLLFLISEKSSEDGVIHHVVGNAQGKYTIDETGIARKKGFSLVNGDKSIDNYIKVETLKEKIRGVK